MTREERGRRRVRKYVEDYCDIRDTVESRKQRFEKKGIPYVHYKTVKANGNKVEFVIRTDIPSGRKLVSKKAFAKLYKK